MPALSVQRKAEFPTVKQVPTTMRPSPDTPPATQRLDSAKDLSCTRPELAVQRNTALPFASASPSPTTEPSEPAERALLTVPPDIKPRPIIPSVAVQRNAWDFVVAVLLLPTTTKPSAETAFAWLEVPPGRKPIPVIVADGLVFVGKSASSLLFKQPANNKELQIAHASSCLMVFGIWLTIKRTALLLKKGIGLIRISNRPLRTQATRTDTRLGLDRAHHGKHLRWFQLSRLETFFIK